MNTRNVALTESLSTEGAKNYYTGGTFPPIPSREEFHRYCSDYLSSYDFETDYPPYEAKNINKAASAISWTLTNEKKRLNNNKYKQRTLSKSQSNQ